MYWSSEVDEAFTLAEDTKYVVNNTTLSEYSLISFAYITALTCWSCKMEEFPKAHTYSVIIHIG